MLTVYAIPPSLYCAKLRILLRHKGIEWREVLPPGGYGSDEYKQIVASGNLPALSDGDLLIADSEAIAEYLEEQYPEPAMLPKDRGERAKVRELSRFHDTRLEPELRVLFAHVALERRDRVVAARQAQALNVRLAQLARLFASRPVSPSMLTSGDCGFPITFAWIDLLTPLLELEIVWPAEVSAYRNLVQRHAAVAAELAAYRPVVAAWLVSRDTAP